MNRAEKIDLTLKLLATGIATLSIWKYFANRGAEAQAEAQSRSLSGA
ncbi:MAG: hypothetical protein WBW73_10210 [Rhodoplanes sp.]